MGGTIDTAGKTDCLKVRMLGDFIMEYKGKPVLERLGKSSKISHLLQILLYAGPEGIRREVLMSRLYGIGGRKDQANNLRVTLHHLRKQLKDISLEASVSVRDGLYFFLCRVPVEVDAHVFEKFLEAAENAYGAARQELLQEACAVYGGYFLPSLSGEEWVTVEEAHYQCRYRQCVEELCMLLKKQGEYRELLELCSRAASLYPYDEWQIWQMDGLMALGHLREAAKLYEKTTELYLEEFSVPPSGYLPDCLRKMESRMRSRSGDLHEIRERLREEGAGDGGYYCSYPGFVDSYRMIARMADCPGQTAYLLLCSVLDDRRRHPAGCSTEQEIAAALESSIKEALCPEDIFTRYGKGQFLAILSEPDRGECQKKISKIDAGFRRREKSRRIRVTYRMLPIGNPKGEKKD